MTRHTKLVLTIGLAIVVALLCVEYRLPSEGLPRSQTLADGSVFTVEAVSFGTSNYYKEPSPKAWQLAIGKFLPYKLAAGLGWHFDPKGDWSSIVYPDGMTTLVLFTKREGPGKTPSDQIRAVVLDDQGDSLDWDAGGRSGTAPDSRGTHYRHAQSWDVPAYPRRGKTLVLRFLRKQGDDKPGVPILQLHIANPQPGPYPIWTPEPWPSTKDAGDLAVTLIDFRTGLSMSMPTRGAVENEEVVTRLALDLEVKGGTNCPWQVKNVEISDATGNRWNSYRWGSKTQARQHGVTQTMNLPGNLWPGESAWKLRVELVPTNAVPSGENKRFVEFIAKPLTLSIKSETQQSR